MYKRVLVPVDGSDPARRGLDEAIKLGKKLNADLRFIHVVNKLPPLVAPGISPSTAAALFDQLRSSGECILHDCMTAARAAEVSADRRLIEAFGSEAGDAILEEAVSWPADLIVCGTHGRRGVRRIVMGSDAEYILRRSPVPVLMVRGTAAPQAEPKQ